MIQIAIRITPNIHDFEFYDIIETKSIWGWEFSRKVMTIPVMSAAFEDVRLKRCHLYGLLIGLANRRYFLPHTLHLSIFG